MDWAIVLVAIPAVAIGAFIGLSISAAILRFTCQSLGYGSPSFGRALALVLLVSAGAICFSIPLNLVLLTVSDVGLRLLISWPVGLIFVTILAASAYSEYLEGVTFWSGIMIFLVESLLRLAVGLVMAVPAGVLLWMIR